DEAEIAGISAAEYIKSGSKTNKNITIKTDGKVRYTVPQRITRDKDITVYYRVSDIFENVKICVYSGEKLLASNKKRKVVPGEMETFRLPADVFKDVPEITFKLEEGK
ncbi:MAG: hypothetical protein WCX81_02700, partial [Monoglobales bacterium]